MVYTIASSLRTCVSAGRSAFRSERVRLVVFGEVFNLLNTVQPGSIRGNIPNPAEFGQPGACFTQIFGSGGPRAFQLGMSVNF